MTSTSPRRQDDGAALFALRLQPGFLGRAQCDDFIARLRASDHAPASVYGRPTGGAVDDSVRKVLRIAPPPALQAEVVRLLDAVRPGLAAHFALPLTALETPQFLRYRTGDFFVAHQDGNTGMLAGGREQSRKVSVVLLLNDAGEAPAAGTYGGGDLVFTAWRADRPRGRHVLRGEAGLLVAFRAEETHEVTPVLWGERFSVAAWFG